MGISAKYALLAAANVLMPIAILVFATGFFPYKPFLSGLARYEDLSEYGKLPEAPFDRVIFMVVDALRSDFVFSHESGFRFTQSLIVSGSAVPFTAHATSPTITMPRVKAITTGSIPSFLDVILNFAESDTTSTLATQDTWLAQLKAKPGGRLVMYGDDTWLKLFPRFFERADGTSSFFVSDFTEVDNNVTRHVPEELRKDDWNGMIMHYLGLDHIGHKTGPRSTNMIPKQKEMDGIVETIFRAMETENHLKSALFVLLGDHGMNDAGNHGGSAPGETSPALVFISPKFKPAFKGLTSPIMPTEEFDYYTKIEQSDIVPTLAGLLGFPVPLNNLGVFIPELLSMWQDKKDRMQLLHRNALQILNIVRATFPGQAVDSDTSNRTSSEDDSLALRWNGINHLIKTVAISNNTDDIRFELAVSKLLQWSQMAQDLMSSQASNYDMIRLSVGLGLAVLSFVLSIASLYDNLRLRGSQWPVVFAVIVGYAVMMFASSYVEEEQHFWYWTTTGWLTWLGICSIGQTGSSRTAFIAIFLVAMHRLSTRWNQTGQKHAGDPDVAHTVFTEYPALMWCLVALTYVHYARDLCLQSFKDLGRQLGGLTAAATTLGAFCFKLAFTSADAPELLPLAAKAAILNSLERSELGLLALARTVFLILSLATVYVVAQAFTTSRRTQKPLDSVQLAFSLRPILAVFLITQSRTANIPLFLIFHWQYEILTALLRHNMTSHSPRLSATITTLLLSHVSFFALGNSNAISSVDLSNAYNAIGGYNVGAVGVLVFLSNWAGPVWWAFNGWVWVLEWKQPAQSMPRRALTGSTGNARPWIQEERDKLADSAKWGTPVKEQLQQESRPPSTTYQGSPVYTHLAALTLFTCSSTVAVMAACTVLRTHLFIWTVFSPKYLYTMAWNIIFHICINVGISGLVSLA